ncbi:MAG TPA: chromosome segregation protein SMC [Blastocatellia bacterium]|nr:chromosome segregation protein SMC [Blastocatellia bacterium]
MLKLEKLELRGFKSFGDETEITFPGAITAIVGPNGCGKSNIADGILWVLGEQSARSLRGTRMEDVIFQGSRSRPPVGMTEVVLTLSAVADIEISANGAGAEDEATDDDDGSRGRSRLTRKIRAGEVITVARRLYRSGTSEYFIDGQHVRLRDIYDLFAGTGLGPGHYAIIGQDRISELINAKPYERRAIIEEAAGITKFRLRQRAIELRLESTRQNLARINDIIAEVERQVASLKRQAARARRYRRLREELRTLLRILFRLEYRRIADELETVQAQIETLAQEKAQLLAEISRLESEQRDLVERSRRDEAHVHEIRERLARADLEIERATSRRTNAEQQQAELIRRFAELERDEHALKERMTVISREQTRLRAEADQLASEIAQREGQLADAESEHARLLADVRSQEEALERLRARFVEAVNAAATLRNARQQIEEAIRRIDLRLKNLRSEGDRARQRRAELLRERQQLADEIERLREHVATLVRTRDEIASALAQARAIEAAERNELAEQERTRIAWENRLQSLIELDAHHAYYSDAVQYILHLPEAQDELHLLGTLADKVQVDPRWEKMVEAVLGERLQAILVPSLEDAWRAIERLTRAGAGRAQFLVVGIGGGQGNGGTAASSAAPTKNDAQTGESSSSFMRILGLDPMVQAAFARAYPEYETAEVVRDRDAAVERSLADPGRLFVTPEGEWVRGGCLLSGGADPGCAVGLLAVKREIRELRARLDQLTEHLRIRQRRLADHHADIEACEEKLGACESELREQEKTLFEKEVRFSEIEREIERVDQQLRVVAFEQTDAMAERTKALDAQAQIEAELARSEEELRELEGRSQQLQAEIALFREKITEAAERVSHVRVQLAAANERKQSLSHRLRHLDDEYAECERRGERIGWEKRAITAERETLSHTLEEVDAEISRLLAERSDLEEALNDALGHLAQVHQTSDHAHRAVTELREKESSLRDQLSQAEIARATLQSQAQFLHESCFAELAHTLEEVLAQPDDLTTLSPTVDVTDPQAIKHRIEELRRRLEEAGPVNMMALDELQQAEQRYEFLRRQREDIERSLASTEQALQEIRRRSRQRFLDAFHAINENFSAMFQELFGGGRGEMILLDPENILESGIDIIAQPPGKRLQNIHLLSGGEKALAALALLLAIFRYRPSPFCVLDEVDAALDDVNVARFSQKLIEMSERTQFIVITHNKETMEAAHVLYGVTMEEPGVSKLVSVRLQ